MPSSLSQFAEKQLAAIRTKAAFREFLPLIRQPDQQLLSKEKAYISFSCNDYLGLTQHPLVKEAAKTAIAAYGAGAGASRLVTGDHPLYTSLEQALAQFHQREAALVFGSGYMANLGVISALVGKNDLVIADKFCHASILDGIKLSGAHLLRFQHNSLASLREHLHQRSYYRHCLVITESVFSMDGDCAPLLEMSELCTETDSWLLVDHAHSLVPTSSSEDVIVGTLSKMLASYGGYIAGERSTIEYIRNTARPLIFSTGLPPSVLAAASQALEIIRTQPELLMLPLQHARFFTERLHLNPATSAIVPLILGSNELALNASHDLKEKGFLVTAIRPPTVPAQTARLRFTFAATHRPEEIERLCDVIEKEPWFKARIVVSE